MPLEKSSSNSSVTKTASVSGRDSTRERPSCAPKEKQVVLRASPSTDRGQKIVTDKSPFSKGAPVDGSKM